jgi:hypothetical protein
MSEVINGIAPDHVAAPPEIDSAEAWRFLQAIEAGGSFTLQTYPDVTSKFRKENPEQYKKLRSELCRVLHWPGNNAPEQRRVWNELVDLNTRGAAVTVSVNETDGNGRGSENVTKIRANYQDDANGYAGDFPLPPSVVVGTSPGHFQRWWLCNRPADEQGGAHYVATQERIIVDLGSDPGAKSGCAQVLRLPGFLHHKTGTPHPVRILDAQGWKYKPEELSAAFPPVIKEAKKANGADHGHTNGSANGSANGSTYREYDPGDEDGRIRAALFSIPSHERSTWIRIGMALENHYGKSAQGRALWDEWSETAAEKYDADDQDRVWASFKGGNTGIGTLFQYAKDRGWTPESDRSYEEWCRKHADDPAKPPPQAVFSLKEWLERELPKAEPLFGHWLVTTNRTLIGAPTGLGKTMFGMAVGMRIAAAVDFLHWQAQRPARVLYVDGEMSRELLKERMAEEVKRLGMVPETFYALSHEDIDGFQPLNTKEGQDAMNGYIESIGGVDLIILDNIMCLTAGDQKDEEVWSQTLPWAKSLTNRRIAQLWFHHTGHDETKLYGTKTREWQMDTVILLEEVKRDDTDLSFRLKFKKARQRKPINRADFREINMALVDNTWTSSTAPPKRSEWTKALRPLRDALAEALLQAGQDHRVGGDGPLVKAADVEKVRDVYRRRYVSGGDQAGRDNALRMAWKRNLRQALDCRLIGGEVVDDQELVWFVKGGDGR